MIELNRSLYNRNSAGQARAYNLLRLCGGILSYIKSQSSRERKERLYRGALVRAASRNSKFQHK